MKRLFKNGDLKRYWGGVQAVFQDPFAAFNQFYSIQRVMIARALVVNPHLLIADEPTGMLDASLCVTVLNLMMDLRKQHNMSIAFITHDLGQVY